MTSPALQEIIAVLAAPAAGNPSQYLFERALEGTGLDWRIWARRSLARPRWDSGAASSRGRCAGRPCRWSRRPAPRPGLPAAWGSWNARPKASPAT